MFDDNYINLFDKNRNLVPMISIEGDKSQTDERRGIGTYNSIMTAMDSLNKKGILFGGSITVTTENIKTVTSKEFIQELYKIAWNAISNSLPHFQIWKSVLNNVILLPI